jgi:hypothetical protein
MVTESGDLIVLAIQRRGEDAAPRRGARRRRHAAAAGHVVGARPRLDAAEVLVVNSPDLVRRQAVPMGRGAKTMIAVLAAMVLLLATGAVPPAVAGLLAAGAVVLTGS